jgi:ankyrin repeat protein
MSINEGDLYMACDNQNIDAVRRLIDGGADINKIIGNDETPLIIACRHENIELITLLLESGANVNQATEKNSPLHIASMYESIEIIHILFESGADPNVEISNGFTPLHTAAEYGRPHSTQLLLEYGSSINKPANSGETALIIAADTNNYNIIQILIRNGADMNIQDKNGFTALIKCISTDVPYDIVNEMLLSGADPLIVSYYGDSPIHAATYYGRLDIVILLLDYGVDVNAATYYQNISENVSQLTPLHIACYNNNIDMVEILLERGADKTLETSDGKTPYDNANEQIKMILTRVIPQWKGWSKSDDKMLDILFTDDAKNFTVCPVCLKYTQRRDGCMYMHHNCKELGGFYDKILYAKYKNQRNEIEWCTFCNRICKDHKHYELGTAGGKIPAFATADTNNINTFFEDDCRGANGGGGFPEKIKRFSQLRRTAQFLKQYKDDINEYQAMKGIVGALWDAPFSDENVNNIIRNKKWNFLNGFNNIVNIAEESNAPNIHRGTNAELLPRLTEGMNEVSLEEGPIVEFVHRMQNGRINEHVGQGIGLSSLKEFIRRMNMNFGLPEFGYCWNIGQCDARLHPDEVARAFQLLGEPNEELVAEYRTKFNKKFQGRVGGRRTRRRRALRQRKL